jgi:hypothetical protein
MHGKAEVVWGGNEAKARSSKSEVWACSSQLAPPLNQVAKWEMRACKIKNQKSSNLAFFPFTDYCALKPTQQQLNDDYASSGGVKSSNYRQSWAATVRNVVAKKWPSLRRKACKKVSPIKRNTPFLICKRAISMIKHPVKHPQKGHFSNVGLLRFLSRVQKCIRFGYNT